MIKKRFISMLVLLAAVVTGAWAQRLYLEVNGTAATLKYSANEADYSGKPSFTGTMWQNASGFKTSVETITVDASCENFAGDKLQNLFAACATLTSVTGLGTINTTNVTSMQQLFNGCSSLASLDLSGFNTANVTTMQKMFYGCSSLASLDLSGFNTANVTTMQNMFGNCSSLETVDLSSFNTASVTIMTCMFYECSKLETIFVGDDWSTASSTDYMFYNCTSLPNWDGTDDGTKAYYGGDGKGYLTYKVDAPAASTYTVTLKEGTDDATNWQGKAGEGEYQALPLEGVAAGTAVSVKYDGTKKVKSVKAKKKAPAGPTAYTLAESTQGMIVGTNGKAYDVADKDNLPTGVTAAGVVAYKNGSNGLVIALADEASTMYWSTANGETGAAAHTPTVTGYSWRLPSMDEWKQMFGANGGNNESYTGLNTAINTAGGTALLVENGIYWTCTETAYASGHYIAYLNANVSFFMDDDNNANRIRACIAF